MTSLMALNQHKNKKIRHVIASLKSETIGKMINRMPEASSTMRLLSSARCTDVRLYILRMKIGTNQRALGELSHC